MSRVVECECLDCGHRDNAEEFSDMAGVLCPACGGRRIADAEDESEEVGKFWDRSMVRRHRDERK